MSREMDEIPNWEREGRPGPSRFWEVEMGLSKWTAAEKLLLRDDPRLQSYRDQIRDAIAEQAGQAVRSGPMRWEQMRLKLLEESRQRLNREPSPKTLRVLKFIDDQTGWAMETRIEHFRRGLRHEDVLRPVAGPGSTSDDPRHAEFAKPWGILYTAVGGDGPTRWETRAAGDPPGELTLTSATGHQDWIDKQIVQVSGGEIVVEGQQLTEGELGVFVASESGRFERGRSEVFAIRRASGSESGDRDPESLSRSERFVDAWRAQVDHGLSGAELAEFLLLFVFDPMTLALRGISAQAIRTPAVQREWVRIIDTIDTIRETLRNLFAPEANNDKSHP